MFTATIVFTLAIVIINLIKVVFPTTIFPFFYIYWLGYEIKFGPTMWFFFYPSLIFQVWFWLNHFAIV